MSRNELKRSRETCEIVADWDDEGIYVYQAYRDGIADWSLEHQQLGGPDFNPTRMTWIKPSFAWVLYRSGYANKHNQSRILKIKLRHESFTGLLARCRCGQGGGGSLGRIQWDPARDLFSMDGRKPREMLQRRAIQIGLKGKLSEEYVKSIIRIEDRTDLARKVEQHHRRGSSVEQMLQDLPDLPRERVYQHESLTEELMSMIGIQSPK